VIVGLGVDIVDIRRMRLALERQGDRFIQRIYTEGEQRYCRGHRDQAPCFAARFAAKEALFKALGTGWARGVTWRDVEVQNDERGAPRLVLSGRAAELSQELGSRDVHISLSHSEESAIAIVILEK
jgi:holo-[acyl-carrier protein] synthase